MSKHLVIVESPAKSKTLQKYLGKDYQILASYGHVRDLLPKEGAVDPEQDFAMTYQVIDKNQRHVDAICKALKQSDDLFLATDPDREGEAISWHLYEYLKGRGLLKDKPVHRIAFHEITKQAVTDAVKHPRTISMELVNAQQARRALDYLVGFKLSPLLWKKIRRGLSAGRVQSPALRMIAEREAEIEAFESREFWTIGAELTQAKEAFPARLTHFEGEKLEQFSIVDGERAQAVTDALTAAAGGVLKVSQVERKQRKRNPAAPFITSTLQQEAARKLGFTAQRTMRTAQQLYEGIDTGDGAVGLITYMRTDSTFLSNEAINMARGYIEKSYGSEYLPEKPNFYRSSNKAAQEAHEAIRPTDVTLHPDDPAVKRSLDERQYKLYRLIWQRFVACQMTPAEWDSTAVLLGAKVSGTDLVFKCTGRHLVFDGFYRAIGVPNVSDDLILPKVEEGQPFGAIQMDPTQHFTSPPPRYTEASLVKKLEAEGIGRPSTYASIISVIQNRKYVEKQGTAFHATDLGMVVTDKLIEGFPTIMDVGYTRAMEAELDAVEDQHNDWVQMLHNFYGPFRENLAKAHDAMTHAKAETEPAPHTCPECGASTVYRFGRNGRFLSCSRYPDCKYAAPIDKEGNPQTPELTEVACPNCGRPMLLRKGRFGPFLSCSGYPDCKGIVNIDRKGFVTPPKVPPVLTDIPCPKCQAPMNLRSSKRGPWLSCSKFPKCRGRLAWTKLPEDQQKKWELILANHEKENPQPIIKTIHGKPIGDEYKPTIAGSEEEAGEDSEVNEDLDAA